MVLPGFRKGYCTGVDDFYYRKNAFSIWKSTLMQGENTFFSPPFSRRVKMLFPFGNWLPRRVKMLFLFSPPFSRFHNNELRKHTLIIRWLHAKAQRFAKFLPHGNLSSLNPKPSTFIVPHSSFLPPLRLCVTIQHKRSLCTSVYFFSVWIKMKYQYPQKGSEQHDGC